MTRGPAHRRRRHPHELLVGAAVGALAVRTVHRTPAFDDLEDRRDLLRCQRVYRRPARGPVVQGAGVAAAGPPAARHFGGGPFSLAVNVAHRRSTVSGAVDKRNGAHGNPQSQLRPRRNSFHGWRPARHWSAFAVMGGMGGCRRASGIYPLGSRATCVRRTPSSRGASRRTGQAQRRSTTVRVGVREPNSGAIQGWSSTRVRVIWAKATGR